MSAPQLALTDARWLALRCQLLLGDMALPSNKEGVAQAVEHLGYVQIDTISVVQRAHHHTLWTRCPSYEPWMLHELQATDRLVFEHWAHALAILPMSDYRYYVPQMERIKTHRSERMQAWYSQNRDVVEEVLGRVRAEGPLTSKDFELPPGAKRGTWWDWKPAKRALELLFMQGDLMVAERRGFQKVYDLTERVLPASVDAVAPSASECGRFQVRRALQAFGVAQEREIVAFLKLVDPLTVRKVLHDLVALGDVIALEVVGSTRIPCYAMKESLEAASRQPIQRNVRILSPFDNMIIQRSRTSWLFEFDYALECYVPAARRKYGYFVLPILLEDRLVGRIDPKADRKQCTLIVRKLWVDTCAERSDEFLLRLGQELARFAVFNGCSLIRVERASPAKLRGAVSRHARRALATMADES